MVGCRFYFTRKKENMNALQNTRVVLASVGNTAATTARTALIDTKNASSCKLIVATSASTNTNATNITVAVTSGANGTSTTDYTSVGSSATPTGAFARVLDVDMRGKDRYLYVTVTPGTTTNDPVSVHSIVGVMEMGVTPDYSTTQVGNVAL